MNMTNLGLAFGIGDGDRPAVEGGHMPGVEVGRGQCSIYNPQDHTGLPVPRHHIATHSLSARDHPGTMSYTILVTGANKGIGELPCLLRGKWISIYQLTF